MLGIATRVRETVYEDNFQAVKNNRAESQSIAIIVIAALQHRFTLNLCNLGSSLRCTRRISFSRHVIRFIRIWFTYISMTE